MSKKSYRRFLIVLFFITFAIIIISVYVYNINHSSNSHGIALKQKSNLFSYELTDVSDYKDNFVSANVDINNMQVIPSGEPIGIYVKASGIMVVDVCEIIDINGNACAPCKDIIKRGDYIDKINGEEIECKNDLIDAINNDNGSGMDVTVKRGNNIIETHINTVKDKNGNNMLGLMIKDDISGIGTLTYISKNGFGALGHSINDTDTGKIIDISDGAIYGVKLINVVKASGNMPGRLEGMIDYSKSNIVGRIDHNEIFGITGRITKNGVKKLNDDEWVEVAGKSEVKCGKAYIKSAISGESRIYEAIIVGLDYNSNNGLKGIEIKVTDKELLSYTNGIVQGMSGSPIIQDGKIIGAVTHVLVDDPTRGYGIFIENMLEHN